MKQIIVMLGLLGGVIFLGSMNANADPNCPSGQYFRMSGRCADAQGNKSNAPKPAVVQHPVKPNKNPPKQPQNN
jgi:hypothetical protein